MRLSFVALALLLGGCGGSRDDRTFPVTGFDRIKVSGADRVTVTTGRPFAVEARGARDLLDQLSVRREGATLVISRRPQSPVHWSGWGWWRAFSSDRARIDVALPKLAGVALLGAPRLDVDRVRGEGFDARVSGAGRLDIDELAVRQVVFNVAGAGEVRAEGNAERLVGRLSGAGELRLRGLHARAADIEVAGAGRVRASVEGPARVVSIGAGRIDLGSQARCAITRQGVGKIRCG